ncbi:uncharacterized protein BXZ73DRAFT_4758, partial [Epithele typhae]|uniref:uncharacterized protein n=1 Tax=Epithele typhae TaxID=378194 RepID=UPI002007DE76
SSIQSQTCRQRLLRVNPLLSRSSRAQTRITYDIMDRPGPGNVLDRLTRHPFALAPLLQPATYPPTARLILHSDKFPNVIVVDANVSKMNTRNHGGGGMRGVGEALGPSTVSAVDGMQYVSILDVLHAVHAGLSIPFSPTEWSALGGAKSWKAAKAYGRRMQAGGKGDWKRGVCHLDLLEGDTALVGIESLSVANAGSSVGLGRVFFGRP